MASTSSAPAQSAPFGAPQPPMCRFVVPDVLMDRATARASLLRERALVGRVSGPALSRMALRDLLQSSLGAHQGRIVDLLTLGRGIFMV